MSYLRLLRLISPRKILYQQKQYANLPSLSLCKTNYEQRREYKKFGHKPRRENTFSKIWYLILVLLFTFCSIDWRWVRRIYLDRMEQREKQKMGIEDGITEEKPT